MDTIRFLINQSFWPDLAKVVLAFIMLSFSCLFFWISIHFLNWYNNLVALEVFANHLRDDSMFELTAIRARLSNLKQSFITRQLENKQFKIDPKLIEAAGSMLLLFFQRERSLLKWGALAINMASSAFKHLSLRGKD